MDLLLIGVLAILIIFMFWNSRKRMQKMKAEQEAKQKQTVPGAEVLLQGGLYGTIVSFDAEDLDKPAEVELAPGTIVKVHSQAILRVVDPVDEVADDAELPLDDTLIVPDSPAGIETPEETRRRLEGDKKNED